MHRVHRLKFELFQEPVRVTLLGTNSTGQKFVIKQLRLTGSELAGSENVRLLSDAMKPHLPNPK